jgi:putative chitinase
MILDLNLLAKTFPKTPKDRLNLFVQPLNKTCIKYQVDTVNRLASFLAQVGHESAGFIYTQENLNYSQQGLVNTFPKYFPTQAIAAAYARKPEKIANHVYANRMGNGPEASGDGWRYRGRGLIQLTGKANIAAFAADMEMKISDALDYLDTMEGATMSAGWYWGRNNLNQWADRGDITRQSKIINGGTNGLEDRLHLFALAKQNILASRG